MSVKNIIFDLGNVLASFRWQSLMKELGIPQDSIERLAEKWVRDPLWGELDRGIMTDDEVIAQAKSRLPDDTQYIDLFWSNIDKVVMEFPYARAWLEDLNARGYRLYLLSNYPESLFRLHSGDMTFLPLFDGMVISSHIKLVKPDAEIFRYLLDKYSLKESECVFMDDTAVNVDAANALGIKSLLFTDYDSAQKWLEDALSE